MKLNEYVTVVCDNCNKTRLECECAHFGKPESPAVELPEYRSGQIGGYVDPNRATQGGEPAKCLLPMSAPLPGPFARVVPTALARKILRSLMDLHVPVSIEYVRSDVLLSVPMTFARVLDKERETAEREAGY